MGTQWPARIEQSHWHSMGSCPGPCFIASSMLWWSTTGQPTRAPHTYSLPCITLQKLRTKTSPRCSMVVTGANWQWHTTPNCRPGPSWTASCSKSSLQPSNSWPTRPLSPYPRITSRRRQPMHSVTGWNTKRWSSIFSWAITRYSMNLSTRPCSWRLQRQQLNHQQGCECVSGKGWSPHWYMATQDSLLQDWANLYDGGVRTLVTSEGAAGTGLAG
jgi:hypothetical protein